MGDSVHFATTNYDVPKPADWRYLDPVSHVYRLGTKEEYFTQVITLYNSGFNGFPYHIETLDVWDGSTRYSEASGGYAVPSKSSSEHIRVCGPGTDYPIALTLEEAIEYVWRVKYLKLNIGHDAYASPISSGSATSYFGVSESITVGCSGTLVVRADVTEWDEFGRPVSQGPDYIEASGSCGLPKKEREIITNFYRSSQIYIDSDYWVNSNNAPDSYTFDTGRPGTEASYTAYGNWQKYSHLDSYNFGPVVTDGNGNYYPNLYIGMLTGECFNSIGLSSADTIRPDLGGSWSGGSFTDGGDTYNRAWPAYFMGKQFNVYTTDPECAFSNYSFRVGVSNVQLSIEATEWWPYKNSAGQPVFNTTSGEQINPIS
jgi:hypothetical protein